MAIWDDVIPLEERRLYERGGMGVEPVGYGSKPVLLIVDMTYGFVDSAFPLGHSETGWPAAHAIAEVLEAARGNDVPSIYTLARPGDTPMERGRWKGGGAAGDPRMREGRANEIVDPIAPRVGEPVVAKIFPSAFFGTNLLSYLVHANADTVIITGMVTSGCVRSTAIDAFSYNYRVIIPQECVADRGQTSHKVALFDIHMKYGDVVPMGEVVEYFNTLARPEGASAAPLSALGGTRR
jgi:nicotinamidase-related amidase